MFCFRKLNPSLASKAYTATGSFKYGSFQCAARVYSTEKITPPNSGQLNTQTVITSTGKAVPPMSGGLHSHTVVTGTEKIIPPVSGGVHTQTVANSTGTTATPISGGINGQRIGQKPAPEKFPLAQPIATAQTHRLKKGSGGIVSFCRSALVGFILSFLGVEYYYCEQKQTSKDAEEETFCNWSNTHQVTAHRFCEPESVEELLLLLSEAQRKGETLRPMGAGISPAGISFSETGMISLNKMEKKISVNEKTNEVTVSSNFTIGDLVEELKKYGLTLQNFASIKEQQVGGFIQAGCHGTGASIPPVNDQVVGMTIATPAEGLLYLSENDRSTEDQQLFHFAQCGLGSLGVVVDVTFKCVPVHFLEETIHVYTLEELKEKHRDLILKNKHIRYMFYPFTKEVVVVSSNPVSGIAPAASKNEAVLSDSEKIDPLATLKELLLEKNSKDRSLVKRLDNMSMADLRDELLALDPLNAEYIAQINQCELLCWKRLELEKSVIDLSSEILGFDCGGQQWVHEICFKTNYTLPSLAKKEFADKSIYKDQSNDLTFIENLLTLIERENIPAPAPIEQRFTSRSQSYMSPVYSSNPSDVFTWIGIIMYLPMENGSLEADIPIKEIRERITDRFHEYVKLLHDLPGNGNENDNIAIRVHWAKLEVPSAKEDQDTLKRKLQKQYPVETFNQFRRRLDPNNVLGNTWTNSIF